MCGGEPGAGERSEDERPGCPTSQSALRRRGPAAPRSLLCRPALVSALCPQAQLRLGRAPYSLCLWFSAARQAGWGMAAGHPRRGP